MTVLSQRVASMEASETLLASKKRQEMVARGLDVISLGLGEPSHPTPPYIVEQTLKDMQTGKYASYPPVAGYSDLRAAIADKFSRENQLAARPEEIVVSTGAKQCIANTLLTLIDPGDEVVMLSPFWVSYPTLVQLAGGKVIYLKTCVANNYTPSAEDLASVLTPKTKLVMFSSPCNPTGAVFSKSDLVAWAKVLQDYPRVFVLADEIYEYINFTGQPHQSIGAADGLKNRVITINGLSKGFALTGWRLGYMHAPQPIAEACEKIQGQLTSGANSLAQRACLHALTGPGVPKAVCKDYQAKCARLVRLVKTLPGVKISQPQGAYYLFPGCVLLFGKNPQGKTHIRRGSPVQPSLARSPRVGVFWCPLRRPPCHQDFLFCVR